MRKLATVVGGAMALTMVSAAISWACTPQAGLILTPPTAAPGSEIRLEGAGMDPRSVVDIHWNSLDDLKLAEAAADEQGRFVTTLIIPQTPPETYFVVAASGQDGYDKIARAALKVTGEPVSPANSTVSMPAPKAGKTTTAGDLWNGLSRQSTVPVKDSVVTKPSSWPFPAFAAGLTALGLGLAALVSLVPLRKRRPRAPARDTTPF